MITGALAAILASTCCLGPLVLITLGISGAWIGSLSVLEPYQPFFIAGTILALVLAWRQIWRPAINCAPDEVCAIPQVKFAYKLLFFAVLVLMLIALGFPLIANWFY